MTRYVIIDRDGMLLGFTSACEACLFAARLGLMGWTWKVEGRA